MCSVRSYARSDKISDRSTKAGSETYRRRDLIGRNLPLDTRMRAAECDGEDEQFGVTTYCVICLYY